MSGTCTRVIATCADDPTRTYCGHGTCVAGTQGPACRCAEGYTGPRCGSCASGYKPGATAGTCVVIDTGDPCGGCGLGQCDWSTPTCTCPAGYAGTHCELCAEGYFTSATDGACVPGCAAGHYVCDDHGTCTDTAGGPTCQCDAGYTPYPTGRCIPAAGLSCADPLLLDFATGSAAATTIGGSASLPSTCGIATEAVGRVLRVTIPTAGRARFRVAGNTSFWLAVKRDCAAAAPELACVPYASLDTPLDLDVEAGDYFVFVQSWQPFPGDFEVAVELLCPAGQVFAAGLLGCTPDPCTPSPCADANQHLCRVNPDGTSRCECDPGVAAAGGAAGPCTALVGAAGAHCGEALVLPLGSGPTELTVSVPAALRAPVSACSSNAAGGSVAYLGFYLPLRSRVRFYATAPGHAISISARRDCARSASEVMCERDGGYFSLGDGPALMGGVLPAGVYTLIIDGIPPGDEVQLAYDVRPDPCAALAPCDGGQQPEPAVDWTSCACACPDGQVAAAAGCVPDPCTPNPCTGAPRRCVPDPAGSRCECPLGALSDGAGGCVPDPAVAEWTVLVYQSLDNNLGVFAGGPTAAVGATDPVHVVWLTATPAEDATLYHAGHGSELEVVQRWAHPDLGDWRTLRAFATLAAQLYPAHHYALVVQDHGGGFEFGWDTGSGNTSISVLDGGYARVLAALVRALGQPLALVDFETCLMANWEVAEATRPYALALLGSPELSYSMDGSRVARLLAADPHRSLADLGHAAVDSITSNAQSFIDLPALAAVTAALNALAAELRAHPELCAVCDALRPSTWKYVEGEADLGAFAAALAATTTVPQTVRDAAVALAAAIPTAVYAAPATASGLSIYLPPLVLPAATASADRALDAAYAAPGATWVQSSTWDELLVSCRQQ
jgi:hypothetical protein